MKPLKILDASVALKWFIEEPSGQEAADLLLAEVEASPKNFLVPDLFFAEMLHVLNRVMQNEDKVKEAISLLEDLGIERVGLGHELLKTAAHIAGRYKLSGYDAIYAATAKLTKGRWYTFDEKAHKKLKSLNISVAVGTP